MNDLEHELYMDMEKGVARFPFVEDENANITGYGHQDKVKFAEEINRYDEYCNGEPLPKSDQFRESDIHWHWVKLDEYGERFLRCMPSDEGAFEVTALWNMR